MNATTNKNSIINELSLSSGQLYTEINANEDKIDILNQSITNSWMGVFEVKAGKKKEEEQNNRDILKGAL